MTPRARISHLEVIEQDGGLLLVDTASHREHHLHPLTAFVWKHADGETSVETLANDASRALGSEVTVAQVWAAIDVLTGAQLMEGRVAPPAGTQRVNRRDLLRSVATGSAAAAALGVISVREAGAATTQEQANKVKSQEQDIKKLAAKESEAKVSQENAEKVAAQKGEQAGKKAEEQAEKKQDQAAQEQSRKDQNQERSIKHENNQEARSKADSPFDDVILDPFNWGNLGDGYAPAQFERRGAHVSLFGVLEYIGEEIVPAPDGGYQLPDGQVITVGDFDPPAPIDVADEEDLEIETMLIGTLPEGARPEGTLVFSVPSDAITGNSEVHITAAGEILLLLEDESDDEMDDAADGSAEEKLCRLQARKRALRRKRMKARHAAQERLRRKRLRRRARKARRHRCTDGKEVLLRGPSEVSLSGITFRVKRV